MPPDRDSDPEPRLPDPRLGVSVLTHDRREECLRTVGRLVGLPERPRIVVVDNGSNDGTAAAVRAAFPEVELLALPDNRGAAGRNAGVAHLRDRPYVALCDDDTWWDPGSLRRAADLLDAHPGLGLVCGRVLVEPGGRPDPTSEKMATSPLTGREPLPGPALLGFLAGASVVRRTAFLAVGGFEPRLFLGGEEELLALELADQGWELAYCDDLVVHHQPSARRAHRGARRRRELRNELIRAWLRLPLHMAVGRTLLVVRRAARDGSARAAFAAAVRDVGWVRRHRRVVARDVWRARRLVDRSGRPAPER